MSVDANDLRGALFVFCLVSSSLESPPQATGSTVPGIPMSQTLTGSIKVRHGNPRKSIWKTAERWFSNPPDPARRVQKTPLPKEIFAKRSGKLRSRQVNMNAKTRNGICHTAVSSRFSSLLTAHSAIFTSFAPFSRFSPFSQPPVRPPALSTAFTPKANS